MKTTVMRKPRKKLKDATPFACTIPSAEHHLDERIQTRIQELLRSCKKSRQGITVIEDDGVMKIVIRIERKRDGCVFAPGWVAHVKPEIRVSLARFEVEQRRVRS